MLAFPSMLTSAAEKAGIPVPPDPDKHDEVKGEFPQFHVFCTVQLGRRMSDWQEHWDNAHVIAKFTPDQCKTVTLGQLVDAGLRIVT